MADDELLGRIPRDAKNEFKVTRGRYWNTDYVDIRLHTNVIIQRKVSDLT